MRTLLLLVVMLSVGIFHRNAEAIDEGWEIEQRCLPEPSAPPTDWSFAGTILMRGFYGIHGFRADWETPRVLVFLNDNFDLPGGALSPDGKWYASPYGHPEITETFSSFTVVNEIRVYSTVDDRIYHVLAAALFYGSQYSHIIWLDEQQFLSNVGGTIDHPDFIAMINPFTQEVTDWEYSNLLGYTNEQFLSHDHMFSVFREEEAWELHNLATGQVLRSVPLNYHSPSAISWSPDSSHFVAEISDNPDEYVRTPRSLVLFDRQGNQEDMLMALSTEGIISYPDNAVWSDDGRYLALLVNMFSRTSNLYIADFEEEKIVDTCFAANAGLAWIPSTHNLLLIHPTQGVIRTPVVVSDVDQSTAYTVAYHEGAILGWRAD